MAQSKVVFILTSPETVIADYKRLLHLLPYTDAIKPGLTTVAGIDLSWHHFYPACSSPPWQIDGVLGTLTGDGFSHDNICPVVTEPAALSVRFGEILNRHQTAAEKHDMTIGHPHRDGDLRRIHIPGDKKVYSSIFSDSIDVPDSLPGSNLVLLPTMKTHASLTIAGALYTACNLLLGPENRRVRHVYHDALVESFAMLKETTAGMVAVMDGTFAGQGPGPQRLLPHVKNIIAASNDPLALDAVAARLMGFDPFSIPFIRDAHKAGLGTADFEEIEIVGDDLPEPVFGFSVGLGKIDTFLDNLESSTSIPFGYRITRIYNDWYWIVHTGEKRMKAVMNTGWGNLFEKYRK